MTAAGSLTDVVHDGAGAQLGATSFVFGGGSPTTFATVQSLGPSAGTGRVAGQLPQPRSDVAAATVGRTVYLVGGYDGTNYEPSVLATEGRHQLQYRGHAQGARALPGGRRARQLHLRVRRPDRERCRQRRHRHDRHSGDRPRHPLQPGRRRPSPSLVRRGRVRDRGPRLRRRRSDGRRADAHADVRVRRANPPGRRRRAAPPGHGVRGLRHGRIGAESRRVPRGRRGGPPVGERPGRRRLRLPAERDLSPAEHVRRAGRLRQRRRSLPGPPPDRRPRQQPASGDRPGAEAAMAVPVRHDAAAARAGSTSPTTPSSSTRERGSSPTRRRTTPSWRSATRRGSSFGSTATPANLAAHPAT